MNKNVVAAIAVISVIALAGLGGWSVVNHQENSPETMDSIVIAYSPYESGALFWIAVDQHFFEQNGLNITLRKYDSGAASLDGVVNGEADVTVGVSEFPLVRNAIQNVRVRTIGNIDKGDFVYLVARKDRIGNVSDLKGKKIGTALGTVAEFHLGRFLTLHGMTMQDIMLVDVKTPAGWIEEVAEGNIDAIATAQPYADSALARLGRNGIAWPAQSSQPVFALIVTSDTWITNHPELASRFLRSLAQAEEYFYAHPAESKTIVQERLNLDAVYMDTVWKQNQFSLLLDQALILAMEDEARWMIANNLTNATAVPDFRQYVYMDAMETVRPGSVNIIR